MDLFISILIYIYIYIYNVYIDDLLLNLVIAQDGKAAKTYACLEKFIS